MALLLPGSVQGQFGPKGTCRAVVVGISEYQDPDIPDLRYANRDAEAFAKYLQERPVDKVIADNLKLLTNEHATGGNVYSALRSLIKDSKAGDKVVIYFAGHGDVETLFPDEPGHLLVYDTPANNYSSNSLRLDEIRRTVNALITREVQVLIVTDACHAGKLAGSNVNGSQAATSAMAEQFNSEIKIMSCQSNEYSQEGEQWGGGRGVFSWYLIQGLTGMADVDHDLQVTMKELSRYLEDMIEPDVAPLHQTPNLIGDRNARVAVIDEDQLLAMRKEIDPNFTEQEEALASREPVIKESIDTVWVAMSTAYQAALDQGKLLEIDLGSEGRKGTSAYMQLGQLRKVYPDKKEVSELENKLIANLQEVAQQAINAYLKNDQKELIARWNGTTSSYQKYPIYLETAATMLSEDPYMRNRLLALAHYFKAISLRIKFDTYLEPDISLLIKAKMQADSAKLLEPRSAFIPNELGLIEFRMHHRPEAILHYKDAITVAPTWAMPYNNLAITYAELGQMEDAGKWANEALQRDSSLFGSYNVRAKYHLYKGENFLAEVAYLEAIRQNPTLPQPLMNYGLYWENQGRPEMAEIWYQQVLTKTPVITNDLAQIAEFYNKKSDLNRALYYFQQVIQRDSSSISVWNGLGRVYAGLDKKKEADQTFHYALTLSPNNQITFSNLGWFEYNRGDMAKSLEYYQKAIAVQSDSVFCPAYNGAGATLLALGRLSESRQVLARFISACAGHSDLATAYYNLACVESLSGHIGISLEALELSIQSGFTNFSHIRSDSDLKALQDLPEFDALLKKYE
ncbi:MAG: caspase family protein [Saprospiraceae bacterium]|nr:caspase family protein [Saprospiraceae bacterium]